MTRPSHWLLISMAVFATVVTATGSWRRVLTGPRVDRWMQQQGQHAVRAVERGHPVELFGVVMDRSGSPIEGARVQLVEGETDAFTDADGRFGLSAKGRRSHRVEISADGHSSLRRIAVPGDAVCAVLGDETPWAVDAVTEAALKAATWGNAAEAPAAAASKSLLAGEGYVQDEAGRAVPYARVSVRESGAAAFADEHGRYRIPLPADGEVTLIATDREGRVARSASFKPSRRHGIVPAGDLVLGEGLTLSGYVRRDNGVACAGAIVIAKDAALQHVAVTDRRGYYVIDSLCSGAGYTLTSLPFDGLLGAPRHCKAESSADIDLFVHEVESRRVRVAHDGSGDGFAGAHLVATDGVSAAYGEADDDGWVELEGVLPRDVSTALTFSVRDPGHAPIQVQRVDDDTVYVAAGR